eukprot:CAMPEP_0170179802 /NCGR_PEP_ID=MMETSP0040_2-20121228/19235_1 /TAXON_ID=641309 /ORGANISM="Lotharella oceanica, Strain CCMP622" /LENGTH=314 /DNA_ID=CAMNT_0010424101 /DNA_START=105 /DNA_END=1049 /DNA_ORIENTATION=-
MPIRTWHCLLVVLVGMLTAVYTEMKPDIEGLEEYQGLQQRVCTPENYSTEAFLVDNGFTVLKNFVSDRELLALLEDINNVPKNVRYVCGASDIQPEECILHEHEVGDRHAHLVRKVRRQMNRWKASGAVEAMGISRKAPLRVVGSEYITLTGWKFPWSVFKGSWENMMGFGGFPSIFNQLKGGLTLASGVPLYTGFHGWHIDGNGPGNVRFHKLFVMLYKDTGLGYEESRQHSNLVLFPHTMTSVADKAVEAWKQRNPLQNMCFGHDFVLGRMLELLSCTVNVDPGDAIFFQENVFHRTQDVAVSRYAVIFDIL